MSFLQFLYRASKCYFFIGQALTEFFFVDINVLKWLNVIQLKGPLYFSRQVYFLTGRIWVSPFRKVSSNYDWRWFPMVILDRRGHFNCKLKGLSFQCVCAKIVITSKFDTTFCHMRGYTRQHVICLNGTHIGPKELWWNVSLIQCWMNKGGNTWICTFKSIGYWGLFSLRMSWSCFVYRCCNGLGCTDWVTVEWLGMGWSEAERFLSSWREGPRVYSGKAIFGERGWGWMTVHMPRLLAQGWSFWPPLKPHSAVACVKPETSLHLLRGQEYQTIPDRKSVV